MPGLNCLANRKLHHHPPFLICRRPFIFFLHRFKAALLFVIHWAIAEMSEFFHIFLIKQGIYPVCMRDDISGKHPVTYEDVVNR